MSVPDAATFTLLEYVILYLVVVKAFTAQMQFK